MNIGLIEIELDYEKLNTRNFSGFYNDWNLD